MCVLLANRRRRRQRRVRQVTNSWRWYRRYYRLYINNLINRRTFHDQYYLLLLVDNGKSTLQPRLRDTANVSICFDVSLWIRPRYPAISDILSGLLALNDYFRFSLKEYFKNVIIAQSNAPFENRDISYYDDCT